VFRPPTGTGPAQNGEVRALNVGALREGKGHEDLLHALALARRESPQLSVDVVGDGPLRQDLERLAARLELGEAVVFHGALPKDQLAERMRAASFLVLPSRWENAPVAASEALASGLPVLACRVGGIPELVDRDAGMLVPAGDPGALATGLTDMRVALGRFDPAVLSERARERHGPAAVAATWNAIYSEVAAPGA
jgi:glycosyltransferase involved in cell wall biosynthesis